MHKNIPEIIQKVGFDFWWDIKKVWKLKIPIEEMKTRELEWHFDIPFWSTGNSDYNLRPIEVINHPEKYPEHHQRIMNSNLEYPMDIMFNKGRWLFLDGLHRLAKAKLLSLSTVKVRKISHELIDEIKKVF